MDLTFTPDELAFRDECRKLHRRTSAQSSEDRRQIPAVGGEFLTGLC